MLVAVIILAWLLVSTWITLIVVGKDSPQGPAYPEGRLHKLPLQAPARTEQGLYIRCTFQQDVQRHRNIIRRQQAVPHH